MIVRSADQKNHVFLYSSFILSQCFYINFSYLTPSHCLISRVPAGFRVPKQTPAGRVRRPALPLLQHMRPDPQHEARGSRRPPSSLLLLLPVFHPRSVTMNRVVSRFLSSIHELGVISNRNNLLACRCRSSNPVTTYVSTLFDHMCFVMLTLFLLSTIRSSLTGIDDKPGTICIVSEPGHTHPEPGNSTAGSRFTHQS